MRKIDKIVMILMLSIAFGTVANSQCLPPPPIIENVTVITGSAGGDVAVNWHDNPSNPCTTTGYEIYKYNYTTNMFDLFSFVPASITAVMDVDAGGNIRPQIYRVTTKAGPAGNEHSENHHTMYLKPVLNYDPCNIEAKVEWTPYKTSYRNDFEIRQSEKTFNDSVKYQVVGYIAPAGYPFDITNANPLSEITADTVITFPMLTNLNYLFCIKAFLPNGSVSYSNVREGLLAGYNVPTAPQYIILDSIVSFDTHNHLHFKIDTATEMTKFKIERTESLDSAFYSIYTFSDKYTTTYDDSTCNVYKKYFYRVTAFNNAQACDDTPATISDTLNSIIVTVNYEAPDINVSWTDFIGNPAYHMYKDDMFELLQYSTSFIDMNVDINANIYDFCYRIIAVDQTTNYTSISRKYCVSFNKSVIMPDAIDPTSTFTGNFETLRLRNQFAPVIGGSDLDYEYYMVIFNRWNSIIFETTKPMNMPLTNQYMWNGASAKGNVLPEDTYLYYIKVSFKNSEQVFEQRGSVSIIYQ